MRRATVGFLFTLTCLLVFSLHGFSPLIGLLFEDGFRNAITTEEILAWSATASANPTATPTPTLIPKILHQTYTNDSIPERWVAAQQSCITLHQAGWEYRLWTDAAARDLITTDYPWFLDTFDSYPYPIQRADAIRYFILRKYGGVYNDLDNGCARRLDPLLQFSAFARMTTPTGFSNDVLGSVPEHPLFVRATESLAANTRSWWFPHVTIMASTGPLFLTLVWKRWMSERAGTIAAGPEKAHGLATAEMVAAEGYGRLRLLTPDQYSGHAWSFFELYRGKSWHRWDEKWISMLGSHIFLSAILGALVLSLVGWVLWKVYEQALGMCQPRRDSPTPRGSEAASSWKHRWLSSRSDSYDALSQKEEA